MRNLLYMVILILVIGWLSAYFGFGMPGLLPPTLVAIAFVAILIYFLNKTKRV